MPLYEYQCQACGHRFEVIQKYSDPHVTVCPKCGGEVQKLFSSPAIQFKGSGFYITDYARAGKSDGEGSSSKSSESSEAKTGTAESKNSSTETKDSPKGESKSESKSESKTESKGGGNSTASKPASD
jgi:putative FmdB family regulatory protein